MLRGGDNGWQRKAASAVLIGKPDEDSDVPQRDSSLSLVCQPRVRGKGYFVPEALFSCLILLPSDGARTDWVTSVKRKSCGEGGKLCQKRKESKERPVAAS